MDVLIKIYDKISCCFFTCKLIVYSAALEYKNGGIPR